MGVVKIKAIILAAGYGTRLYPLTENTAKPLLEVGGKPILEHTLKEVDKLDLNEIIIVTNHRFYEDFRIWMNHYDAKNKVKIINDGTISNDTRLGAIGDLKFVLEEEDIKEDILVIGGDNLFGFSLLNFITLYNVKKASLVAFHDLKDVDKVKRKYGVGTLSGTKVTNFEEKPWNPKSTLAATACYLFKKEDLQHVTGLMEQGKGDAPGDLIQHLVEKSEVHGFVFEEHWFDIGSHESLKLAEEALHER